MNNIYDYMHSLDVEGKSAGIDAVTVTATGIDGKLSIDLVLDSLRGYIEEQDRKPFKFQGATGSMWGSVRAASRVNGEGKKLWTILMVTGNQSQEAFKVALKVRDVKFTRVDTYIDVKMREQVLGLPRKLYDTYRGNNKITLIESGTGDTFYCGSRESEAFIRIYDKSSEYGEDLGRVWRIEVEYKRGLAQGVANYLAEYGIAGIEELIWSEMRTKDLPVPAIPSKVNIVRGMITVSSSEMKLNWLGRQVEPTVRFLRRLGLESEVKKALQIDLPL